MGGWCRDAGRVEDINEVIKYTFKYASAERENEKGSAQDLDRIVCGLLDLKPMPGEVDPVLTIYKQLHKARLFATFGDFKKFKARYKDKRLMPCKVGDEYAMIKKAAYRPRVEGEGRSENKLISICMPRPLGENRLLIEPSLAISNYEPFPKTETGRRNLVLIERARAMVVSVLTPEWQAASGVAIPPDMRPADLSVGEFEASDAPAPETVLYRSHKHDNSDVKEIIREASGEAKAYGEAKIIKFESMADWNRRRMAQRASEAAEKWNAEARAMVDAARKKLFD
jgi:hypothetical protein